MTSSTPPPFDDGGDLPETRIDRGETTYGMRRTPNYFVRRALAIGALVVVLAGASVLAGRLISRGGDDETDSAVNANWNTVVIVADDEVRLVDPDTGDVTSTFPGDAPLLAEQSLATGNTLLFVNDFGRITELDLEDGTIRRTSAGEGSTLVASTENASIVLAGPPTGGDVTVVDTAAHGTIDIGEVAGLGDPLMFAGNVFVNPSASHVATADARSFQSVLVDIGDETAVLLAGQVVALNDRTVVTAQRAGAEAELEFYDLQGVRRGSADAASPQATMLTSESTVLTVSADGLVESVDASGEVVEVRTIVQSADQTGTIRVLGGRPALDSKRLLIETADGVVLLDEEGTLLARLPGALLSPVTLSSRCAVVGSTRPAGTAVHVDLETGEQLGEFSGGTVASASADGCTVSIAGDAPRVVARGLEVSVPTATRGSITIAPDGGSYVIATTNEQRLVSIDGDDDEPAAPIRLATGTVLVHFAEV